MAGQGASLQNYNNELVKCIEDLREKREEINRQILKEEEEKAKVQRDLSVFTEVSVWNNDILFYFLLFYLPKKIILPLILNMLKRLSKINEALARKLQARNEYDRTIQETEAAYMKILESSQVVFFFCISFDKNQLFMTYYIYQRHFYKY
jgi:Sjoegren syndrome nuclear autoantigen 1